MAQALAGTAKVSLKLDDDALQAGLKAAQRKLRNFGAELQAVGKSFMAIGATVAAPLVYATKVFSDAGDAISKMSDRTKLSAEALSTLRLVARGAGQDFSTIEKAATMIRKNMTDAADGVITGAEAFDALGIAADDLLNLNTDQRFGAIADAIKGIEEPSKRADAALRFFGKKVGPGILTVIENMDTLQEKADRLGLIITTDQAKSAAGLSQEMGDLSFVVESVSVAIGSALAPAITEAIIATQNAAVEVREYVKQNKELIMIAGKAAIIIGGVGAALYGVGVAAGVAGTAIGIFGSLLKGVTVISAALVGLPTTMAAVGTAAASLSIALGALTISVTALGTALLTYVAAPAAVAIGFYAIGVAANDLINKILPLNQAFADLYTWLFDIREMSMNEVYAKQLEMMDDQLKRGAISAEEYAKRLEALNAIKTNDPQSSGAPTGPQGPTADELEESIEASLRKEQQQAEILKRRNDLESDRLKLIYEGFSLQRAQLNQATEVSRAEAQGNEELLRVINEQYFAQMQLIDMEEARTKEAEKRTREEMKSLEAAQNLARIEEQKKSANEQTTKAIEDLQLEAMFKGVDLEREKLKLAKQRALLEASAAGASLDLVLEEYALREAILEASEAAKNAGSIKTESFGTFSSLNGENVFATSNYNKQIAETSKQQLAENKKTNKLLQAQEQLAFA
jgi:hypothetical protein